ncbi:MAG: energy transducer TonB [Gammaproteobacteria bacterium]|nr:energy transducer TonB [Gammaproteobacteria bacterium]
MRLSGHPAQTRAIALGLALVHTDVMASDPAIQADPAAEAEVRTEPMPLDLYTPPQRKEQVAPEYPHRALRNALEGWVRLEFMVDPEGKAYEISVSRSMGHDVFESAAIRALEQSTFEHRRDQATLLDGLRVLPFSARRQVQGRRRHEPVPP